MSKYWDSLDVLKKYYFKLVVQCITKVHSPVGDMDVFCFFYLASATYCISRAR